MRLGWGRHNVLMHLQVLGVRRGMGRYGMGWEFLASFQLGWEFNERHIDIVSFGFEWKKISIPFHSKEIFWYFFMGWEFNKRHIDIVPFGIRMEKDIDIISFEGDFLVFFYGIRVQ